RRDRRARRIWDTPTGQPRSPGCFRPIRSGPVMLTDGTYWLGPSTGRLLIKTGRAGLGRRAGHDLTIEATQWSGEALVAVADPARSWVNVTVETGCLQVRAGTGGLKP